MNSPLVAKGFGLVSGEAIDSSWMGGIGVSASGFSTSPAGRVSVCGSERCCCSAGGGLLS